jgi:hypothetical protein
MAAADEFIGELGQVMIELALEIGIVLLPGESHGLGLEDERDCVGVAAPLFELGVELLAARWSEGVELGHAAVFGFFPFGGDEAFALEAVEGGVEGALLDLEDFLGGDEDALGDAVAMGWGGGDGFEEEEFEGALEEV